MKSNEKIIIVIVTFALFLLFVYPEKLYFSSTTIESLTNFETQIEKKLKSASYWDLTGSPIYIDDSDPDYSWSKIEAENEWCRGNGTQDNPYIIENVTINGQESGSCIEIKNSDIYFIINNSTLYNSGNDLDTDAGIKLYNVNNGKLLGNNISFNGNGIFLTLSSIGGNNTVSGNFVNNNSGVGIKLRFGKENIIAGNNVSHNSCGISSTGSHSNFISENIVNNNFGDGLNLQTGNYITISGNSVYNNTNTGILLHTSYQSNIMENNISYNKISGIEINTCWVSTISGNKVNSNNFGIYLEGRGANEISGNNASYNNYGVYSLTSNENNISRNNVYNNRNIGIYLENSDLTNIFENSVNNNLIGIYLNHSNDNNIIENSFDFNSLAKEESPGCEGNYFKDNSGIPNVKERFPFEIVIIIVISLILIMIIAGIVIFKRKSSREEIMSKNILSPQELKELQESEAETSLEKGQHFCVVHRGKIVGSIYLCPTCETYYCMNCATVLKNRSETCWGCNNEIKF